MRQALILKVPEGTLIDDASPEVQRAVSQMLPVWPSAIMIGTQPVDGYQLHYSAVTIPGKDPLSKLLDLILGFKLDWVPMGFQTFHNERTVEVGIDEETELPLYENKPIVYLPLSLKVLDYIIPAKDEKDNDIKPTIDNLSVYSGQVPWETK